MRFKVQQYEIHVVTYYVDAEDRVAAVDKIVHGGAKCCLDGREFLEVAEDLGLQTEDYTEAEFDELSGLGLLDKNHHLASIHSVEEAEL